jgi:hypothetical protein
VSEEASLIAFCPHAQAGQVRTPSDQNKTNKFVCESDALIAQHLEVGDDLEGGWQGLIFVHFVDSDVVSQKISFSTQQTRRMALG